MVTILITAVTSGSIATAERSAGIAVDPVWVVALHLQQRDLEVVSNQTNHEMEEHAQLCGKFYLYCVSIVYQIRLGHHILVGCHHLRYLHLRKSSKTIIARWKLFVIIAPWRPRTRVRLRRRSVALRWHRSASTLTNVLRWYSRDLVRSD